MSYKEAIKEVSKNKKYVQQIKTWLALTEFERIANCPFEVGSDDTPCNEVCRKVFPYARRRNADKVYVPTCPCLAFYSKGTVIYRATRIVEASE